MQEPLLVEANLRAALSWFGQALPGGKVRQIGGVELISTGIASPIFNAALLASRVENRAELERAVAVARVFFEAEALPWAFWLCEDLVADQLKTSVSRIFAASGLEEARRCPGMYAQDLVLSPVQAEEFSVVPICDERTSRDFCDVTAQCFGLSKESLYRVYAYPGVFRGPFCGYVGYFRGQAVSSAATFRTADTIGLYSVGTIPSFQGRGFATCLTQQALRTEFERRGPAPVVLEATSPGYWLYRKMGFREVTSFRIYLSFS